VVNVISITEIDINEALALPMNDFEDAVVSVCAKKANADYIVSRDEAFAKAGAIVDVITPKQLIDIL